MQTIIVALNPAKLENPDLDLCYYIPDRIEETSNGAIQDNGYDYIDTEKGNDLNDAKEEQYHFLKSRRKSYGINIKTERTFSAKTQI